ncbi:response regulator [Nodosilinea sp. PGN35]|uniref:response regulator n=1 Tax=Nodosilinea sp. PGN35 TaxID=3020489 RepID=UPI0023B2A943|nr:response regulator [Nodosilinea sp. TSF1-S3]MDF0366208.1 response regulator [Nodosilinea sp. TSF1-S3]
MDFNTPTCQGHILIVDDLADNLRILSDTLSSQGHRVRAVRSGSMAIIGAKAAPPDVILLDIRMPAMDGFEVCRQLKNDAATQHIPVIFLSALDEAIDKTRAFEAGGVDYITKPFQVVEVQARVHHQLTIQQLQRQVVDCQKRLRAIATLQSPGVSDSWLTTATRAVDTLLAYTDHLNQTATLSPEQALRLQDIQRYGQAILSLLPTLDQ